MVLTNSSSTTNVLKKKATQGRKKIEMKKIEQVNSLQVTFSKRRPSLFNKASELCVLTGAEIAMPVQSPAGGRVFAFGHPIVDHVLDKYLTGARGTSSSSISNQIQNPKLPVIKELNEQYEEILKELEEEKKKKDVIEESNKFWYDQPIDGLALEELEEEKKKKDVIEESNKFWYDQPIDGLALEEVQQFEEESTYKTRTTNDHVHG